MHSAAPAARPPDDALLQEIAAYVDAARIDRDEAYATARLDLMDSLGCAFLALGYPDCRRLIAPVVPGAVLPGGARVPGTDLELDPIQAAFCIGTLIRWLDYNDTFLAAEWGHPSDNLGGILAVADWLARAQSDSSLTVRDVLTAFIKATEIQGVLALENAFNRDGIDHVILVRVASAAVVTHMLGGTREQITAAVSHAWIDGGPLRTYRQSPNTGPRKSWAAGDATARGVRLALWVMNGQMGCPTALTAPTYGFCDALHRGRPIVVEQAFGTYVIENILFKVAAPAEFHAQTALEAAAQLHPLVRDRIDRIQRVRIETQQPAMRIINKTGRLHNPADRDHCLQYIVAAALLHGVVTADVYEDEAAADPRIDRLRSLMEVVESTRYSVDYLDPQKRSIANAVQVFFHNGTATERIEIEYPLGHRRRRDEAAPLLFEKFQSNAASCLPAGRVAALTRLFSNPDDLDSLPVNRLLQMLTQW
jgi:2-methylcitrate dehydratase